MNPKPTQMMSRPSAHVGPRLAVLAVGASLVLAACGTSTAGTESGDGPEEAESISLTIGSALPETSVPGATAGIMNHFTSEVEERVAAETDHTVEFRQVWGGTVAGPGEEADAIEAGLLDIGTIVGSYHPEELQYLNLSFCAPFASVDPVLVSEAFNRTWEANPELEDHLRNTHGVMRIGDGLVGTGPYGVVSTFPADSMESIENQRLLGVGSAVMWLEGTGATPQAAPLADWYTLLQTGAADGVLSFLDGMDSLSLHEVTDYISPIAIGTSTNVILAANEASWDSLPESVQTIMLEVSSEVTQVGADATQEAVENALAIAEEHGSTVIDVDPRFQEGWAEATAGVPGVCVGNLDALGLDGAKIMGDFIDAQVDLGHEFPIGHEISLD